MRTCVCARVKREKHPFQDSAISLLSLHIMYMLELIIKVMWDYVSLMENYLNTRTQGFQVNLDMN